MSSRSDKQKIKVAYVLTPIDFGGAEKVSLNFLKNFNRDKFQIIPILLIRPWEKKVFFTQEIEKYNMDYLTIPVAIKPSGQGRDYFRISRCYRKLFSFCRKEKFNIIHTNGYFADILGIPLSKIFRIPHIATCHGFIQNDTKLRLYNKLDIFFLKFSNKIISVSADIKEKLVSLGVPEKKILTLRNAVEVPALAQEEMEELRSSAKKRFNLSNDDIVIGYVGRLSEEKGLKFLLDAGVELHRRDFPVKILFIGEGPEREFLEAYAHKIGIEQNVIFTGFQKDVGGLLSILDMFVLPSLTEGTPMALLEAMSYGVPVIATRVGGIPKIIENDKNGILVPPSNASAITAPIIRLLTERQFYVKLSRNAKKTIQENYSLMGWVHSIENIYNELINEVKI